MSNLDQLLEPTGYKFEQLTPDEQATALEMLEVIKNTKITIDIVKKHIADMKYSVEEKLAVANLDPEEDIYLKARLRNYMLLDVLIGTQDKAKDEIETQLKQAFKKK